MRTLTTTGLAVLVLLGAAAAGLASSPAPAGNAQRGQPTADVRAPRFAAAAVPTSSARRPGGGESPPPTSPPDASRRAPASGSPPQHAAPRPAAAASRPACNPATLTVVTRVLRAALGTGEADVVVHNAAPAPCRITAGTLGDLAAAALGLQHRPLPAVEAPGAADQLPTIAAGGRSLLRFAVDDLSTGAGGLCPVQLLPASLQAPLRTAVAALGTGTACLPPTAAPAPSGGSSSPVPSVPGLPSVPGRPGLSGLVPGLPGLSGLVPGLSPPETQPAPAAPPAPASRYPSGAAGYDVSWPQCGRRYPPGSPVAVVGVNDGRAFTTNPCLASEAAWAGASLDAYMNLNSPASVDAADAAGPAGTCTAGDDACVAYNDGYNAARRALRLAAADRLHPRMWWLDIETLGSCGSFPTAGNAYWSCDRSLNARTIQGALDALRASGAEAGIYSTRSQWSVITGGSTPTGAAVPNWLAGDQASPPSSWCDGAHDFAGGPTWLLQLWPSQTYDRDLAC